MVVIRSADATACRIGCAVLRPVARLAGVLSGSRIVASVATCEHHVALTIDDGPHPATTPDLLRVLRRHGARATFFIIGNGPSAAPTSYGASPPTATRWPTT
jgi:peptidoglycan/xylan/chitin deacetylase (PgdA/CDA1 family)